MQSEFLSFPGSLFILWILWYPIQQQGSCYFFPPSDWKEGYFFYQAPNIWLSHGRIESMTMSNNKLLKFPFTYSKWYFIFHLFLLIQSFLLSKPRIKGWYGNVKSLSPLCSPLCSRNMYCVITFAAHE